MLQQNWSILSANKATKLPSSNFEEHNYVDRTPEEKANILARHLWKIFPGNEVDNETDINEIAQRN